MLDCLAFTAVPTWDRASSWCWTAWCGGSQHCKTLKRHGRSLSVVQLRGFIREVCSTEPLKIVFALFFINSDWWENKYFCCTTIYTLQMLLKTRLMTLFCLFLWQFNLFFSCIQRALAIMVLYLYIPWILGRQLDRQHIAGRRIWARQGPIFYPIFFDWGSFKDSVDQFLSYFDHLPTYCGFRGHLEHYLAIVYVDIENKTPPFSYLCEFGQCT